MEAPPGPGRRKDFGRRLLAPVRPDRPPGGSWDDQVVTAAKDQGLRVVNWNVDPQDWRANTSAKQITRRVLTHAGAGSIVDLHDGGGNQSATVKALPAIIKGLRKRGL